MARTKSGEKKKRQQSVQKRDETPEDEFEVETIVDSKGSGKSLLYMVKWRVIWDDVFNWIILCFFYIGLSWIR